MLQSILYYSICESIACKLLLAAWGHAGDNLTGLYALCRLIITMHPWLCIPSSVKAYWTSSEGYIQWSVRPWVYIGRESSMHESQIYQGVHDYESYYIHTCLESVHVYTYIPWYYTAQCTAARPTYANSHNILMQMYNIHMHTRNSFNNKLAAYMHSMKERNCCSAPSRCHSAAAICDQLPSPQTLTENAPLSVDQISFTETTTCWGCIVMLPACDMQFMECTDCYCVI